MSVREVVPIGDPVLRRPAREVETGEIGSAEIQGLIDDLIETKRATNGAGIAANQVGEPVRVAIVEVEEGIDGLIHISELAPYRVRETTDILKEGDETTVKVIDIDDSGKVRLSRKAVIMEAPDYDPAQYAGMGAPAPERGLVCQSSFFSMSSSVSTSPFSRGRR